MDVTLATHAHHTMRDASTDLPHISQCTILLCEVTWGGICPNCSSQFDFLNTSFLQYSHLLL